MPLVVNEVDIDEHPLLYLHHRLDDTRNVRSTASTVVNANSVGSVPWAPSTIMVTSAMVVCEVHRRP
jgi:hypothetical protein